MDNRPLLRPHRQLNSPESTKSFSFSSLNLATEYKPKSSTTKQIEMDEEVTLDLELELDTNEISISLSPEDIPFCSIDSIATNPELQSLNEIDYAYRYNPCYVGPSTPTFPNIDLQSEHKMDAFPMNDYEFMYQIGRGAFGVVAKSFHLKSSQIVAIKQSRSSNNAQMKSFQNEIKIMRAKVVRILSI